MRQLCVWVSVCGCGKTNILVNKDSIILCLCVWNRLQMRNDSWCHVESRRIKNKKQTSKCERWLYNDHKINIIQYTGAYGSASLFLCNCHVGCTLIIRNAKNHKKLNLSHGMAKWKTREKKRTPTHRQIDTYRKFCMFCSSIFFKCTVIFSVCPSFSLSLSPSLTASFLFG